MHSRGGIGGRSVKRTRKWEFVKQEAIRLAGLGVAPVDIAKKTDVRRSTVQRWMAAGKLADTRQGARAARPPKVTKLTKPSEWSATVRKDYQLDATDDQLVTLAETALGLALDPLQSATTRTTAAGRFQSIVKQLALVTRVAEDEKPEAPVAATAGLRPRRSLTARPSGDPRKVLTVVK